MHFSRKLLDLTFTMNWHRIFSRHLLLRFSQLWLKFTRCHFISSTMFLNISFISEWSITNVQSALFVAWRLTEISNTCIICFNDTLKPSSIKFSCSSVITMLDCFIVEIILLKELIKLFIASVIKHL